jgi:hypothetical protein
MSDNDLIKAIVEGLGSEALRVLLITKERHSSEQNASSGDT